MKIKATRWLRVLHRLVGLGPGLLIAWTGLTGSVLAFHREIDHRLNPALWRVEPGGRAAPLEQIRALVEASGGPPIRMLLLPQRSDQAMLVLLAGRSPTDRWEVFVDPNGPRILGRRRFGSAWTEWLKRAHVEVFVGWPGRLLVGAGGIASLALSLSGAWLWWRTRPRCSPTSPRRWLALRLHRRVGVLSLAPLTVLATTGLILIFRPYLTPVLNLATGPMPLDVAPRSSPESQRDSTPPTLDQIRDRALAAYPDARITRIYPPEGPEGTFAVRLRLPEEANPHGNTALRFDRYRGNIVQNHGSRMTSAVQKTLWYAPYPWHTGDALGFFGRVLVSVSGLATVGLTATGVHHWNQRRRARRSRGLAGKNPFVIEGSDAFQQASPTALATGEASGRQSPRA